MSFPNRRLEEEMKIIHNECIAIAMTEKIGKVFMDYEGWGGDKECPFELKTSIYMTIMEIFEKGIEIDYDGPGEEDGPWAEGWKERSGEKI